MPCCGYEIVLDQHDGLDVREVAISQILQDVSIVYGRAESSSKCTTINLLSMVDYGGEVNFFRCQEA